MTDNEIIKALEYRLKVDGGTRIDKEILDLINRQKAEIERLGKELKTIRAYIHDNGLEWDLLSKHKKESKCDCYHTEEKTTYRYHPITGVPIPHKKTVGVCWGTKECDECSCDGNENKCDFYPRKRNGR